MKKLFILFLVLFSAHSFSQDEEVSSEEMDSVPVESTESSPEVIHEPPPEEMSAPAPEENSESSSDEDLGAKTTPPVDSESTAATEIQAQDKAMGDASMPTLTTNAFEEERDFNARKSHWLATFGFEGMEYHLPYEFNGVKKDFKESPVNLVGGRIGLGREFYLGAGFMTSTRVEGYFMGTTFTKAKNAGPEEEDVELSYTKESGQIKGGDIVQTISYLFELKTKNPIMDEMTYLTVEPYILAGFGMASSFNKLRYHSEIIADEDYEQMFYDRLTNAKIGGGISFISRQGFFLNLSVTQNRYDISERKTKGYRNSSNFGSYDKTAKMDPITIYALGGGYKF